MLSKEIQIHYDPYQNRSDILHRIRKGIYKIYIEQQQKGKKKHSSLKKKAGGLTLISKHATILQGANSMD